MYMLFDSHIYYMFEYIVVLKMQVNIKVDTRANKIGIVLLVIVLGCCALYIQHNTLYFKCEKNKVNIFLLKVKFI